MELQSRHEQDFQTYLESIRLKPVTSSKHLLYFKHFREMFGGFITQKTIDSFLTQKTTPNHRATISHLINLLKRDTLLNPEEQLEVSRLVILKTAGRGTKKPIQILTKEEIKKLVGGCKLISPLETERFKLMVLWQYSGGLRINELCQLRFENLNYQGRLRFHEDGRDKLQYQKLLLPPEITKGGVGGHIHIKTDVYMAYFDFLKHLQGIDDLLVKRIYNNKKGIWGKSKKKYSKLFKEQCQKVLGLQEKTSHILRHSRATHLLQEGWTLMEVRDFMRHSSVAVTEKYLHIAKDLVTKKLEKTASSIGNKGLKE